MTLAGSRAILRGGEAFLVGASIPPYQPLNVPPDYTPDATRKLLLAHDEIKRLVGALREGTTLIPLNAHLKGNLVKI